MSSRWAIYEGDGALQVTADNSEHAKDWQFRNVLDPFGDKWSFLILRVLERDG